MASLHFFASVSDLALKSVILDVVQLLYCIYRQWIEFFMPLLTY